VERSGDEIGNGSGDVIRAASRESGKVEKGLQTDSLVEIRR